MSVAQNMSAVELSVNKESFFYILERNMCISKLKHVKTDQFLHILVTKIKLYLSVLDFKNENTILYSVKVNIIFYK